MPGSYQEFQGEDAHDDSEETAIFRPSTMSQHIFVNKFDGNKGLLSTLKPTQDEIIGLKTEDISLMRQKYGVNIIPEDEIKGFISRFLEKLIHPIPSLLILAALITVIFGYVSHDEVDNIGEGITIMFTLFLVCAMDALTSKRCEEGINKSIKSNTQMEVFVRRDDKLLEINAEDLVVGDVYYVSQGMMVPADSILIDCQREKYTEIENYRDDNEPSQKINQINDQRDHQGVHLIVNEVEVTGLQGEQKKQFINQNYQIKENTSNVLYANSCVLSGYGKALVCAVGSFTQVGMPNDKINDEAIGDLKDETRLQKLLQIHTKSLTRFTNWIMLIIVIIYMYNNSTQREHARQNDAKKDAEGLLEMMAAVICLAFAVLPEAESLANQTCINNYNNQPIFKHGKIVYKNQNSLELMGQTDCMIINLNIVSKDKGEEDTNENIYRTLAYLLQTRSMQIILYTDEQANGIKKDLDGHNQVDMQQIKEKIARHQKKYGINADYEETSTDGNKLLKQLVLFEMHIQSNMKQLNQQQTDHDKISERITQYKEQRKHYLESLTFISDLSPSFKYILIKNLKKIGKTISITSSSYEDSFAMSEADIGIYLKKELAMLHQSSDILLNDISYLVDALQFGRTIHDNMQQFLLFQFTTGLNLSIYIIIGFLRYNDSPLSPSSILWMNFIMDTLAGIVFGQQLPFKSSTRIKYGEGGSQDRVYNSVLDNSPPFDPDQDHLFNSEIYFTLFCSSIYQQAVLFYFYYHANLFFENDIESKWQGHGEMDTPQSHSEETNFSKYTPRQTYTFIFQIFILMQMFNFINCALVFRPSQYFLDVFSLCKDVFSHCKCKPGNKKSKGIEEPLLHEEETGKKKEDDQREYNQFYGFCVQFSAISFTILMQYCIIHYGSYREFGFRLREIGKEAYKLSVQIGAGIVVWTQLLKFLRYQCCLKNKPK